MPHTAVHPCRLPSAPHSVARAIRTDRPVLPTGLVVQVQIDGHWATCRITGKATSTILLERCDGGFIVGPKREGDAPYRA